VQGSNSLNELPAINRHGLMWARSSMPQSYRGDLARPSRFDTRVFRF
jgi:hypothetical protein